MTYIRVVGLIVASIITLGGNAVSATSRITTSNIQTDIRLHGAKSTIAMLAKADKWDTVADKMGDGNSKWIALAPKLASGADAGSAEDLGISLAFSLPKNPSAVLAAIDLSNGHILGSERVCGMPFIEDTVKDRPGYKQRTIRAVEAVVSPTLANAKAQCLSALRRAS